MNRCLRFACLAGSLLLAGCVSKTKLTVPNGSPVRYENGTPVLSSQKTNGVVVRILTPEFTKQTLELPALFVAVANGGDRTLDFSTTNVTATSAGKTVRVYTAEELEKRVKRDANMAALAVALNSASQSMTAAMPKQTTTYGTANAYGSGGYATGTYYGTSTTYNPAATAAAQAQINANIMTQMTMLAASREIQLNSLSTALRRNTVDRGAVAGGVVKLHAEDIKSGEPLVLTISIGGETHEFTLVAGK